LHGTRSGGGKVMARLKLNVNGEAVEAEAKETALLLDVL
jgi:aerobic-type carbon monoxide dehydrogenase small subunit (CoxS/CutS family)